MAKAKTGGTYAVPLGVVFSTFNQEARIRGYNAIDDTSNPNITFNGFWLRTSNGVKCAVVVFENPESVEKRDYVVGYKVGFSKANPEKKQILHNELISSGMYVYKKDSNRDYLFIEQDGQDLLEGFWKLVDCVEDIDEIFKHPGGARKSIDINPENYARASAEVIHIAYKYGMPDLLGRGADIFDNHRVKKLITIGYSEDGKRQSSLTEKNPYCEHVVPCTVIEKMAIEMYKNNQSIEDVESMIKENLFVAYISDDEAKKLDIGLNLRMSMPLGWEPGHDPLARLNFAGIELSDYTEPIQKYDFHNSEIFNKLFEVQ